MTEKILNRFRGICNTFLNGDDYRQRDKYLPIYTNNRNIVSGSFSQEQLTDMPETLKKFKEAENKDALSDREIAEFISALHGEIQVESPEKSREVELTSFSKAKKLWNEHETSVITSLRQFLADENLSLAIHGSYGDGGTTGYSDLDTAAVIDRTVFKDPEALVALKKKLISSRYFLHRIDALQHHGHMIIPEICLDNYPEDALPISAFAESGVSVTGEEKIVFRPYRSKEMALENFYGAVQNLERRLENPPGEIYYQKSMLSFFMLLPAKVLQSLGKYPCKKESFRIAREYFTDNEWAAMETATEIREDWPESHIPPIGTSVFYALHPTYPAYYYVGRDKFLPSRNIFSNSFRKNAKEFVKAAERIIDERQ